jgi:hypothetical protein
LFSVLVPEKGVELPAATYRSTLANGGIAKTQHMPKMSAVFQIFAASIR